MGTGLANEDGLVRAASELAIDRLRSERSALQSKIEELSSEQKKYSDAVLPPFSVFGMVILGGAVFLVGKAVFDKVLWGVVCFFALLAVVFYGRRKNAEVLKRENLIRKGRRDEIQDRIDSLEEAKAIVNEQLQAHLKTVGSVLAE